jgi:hypothetical protein
LAELEYAHADGAARGLISYDRALENCLAAIEQPPDLSYVVEDTEFIAEWQVGQPDSPDHIAWRFTVQGAKGLFIVAVDAESGDVLWTNQVDVGR